MPSGSQAISATDFVNSIGVNVHLSWQNTVYGDQAAVTKALSFLGVHQLRDGPPSSGGTLPFYQQLAGQGYKFTILVDANNFGQSGNFSQDLGNIGALEKANPGSVAAIEGFNEINLWPVSYQGSDTKSNLGLGRPIQELLYSQVKGDAALHNVTVLALTVGGIDGSTAAQIGDLSSSSDYANWHVYFSDGVEPAANLKLGIADAHRLNPNKPVWITETGYHNNVNEPGWGGVDKTVQAKLTLNLLMDTAALGVPKTFLYELVNDGTGSATSTEGSFGLFENDWTPKAAATGIHNLTAILADPGGSAPGTLNYTISGMPSNGNSLLLAKAGGIYDLVLWPEPAIWDPNAKAAKPAPPVPVTIKLDQAATAVKVFDPLVGTSPVASTGNASNQIAGAIFDHPVILEITTMAGLGGVTAAVPATQAQPAQAAPKLVAGGSNLPPGSAIPATPGGGGTRSVTGAVQAMPTVQTAPPLV
jgi:hypothetical protein